MKRWFGLRSFSSRLVVGLFILILMTTLSAGVPAYWLTRSELERQAWLHVLNTQQATLSLLQAEQNRLLNLATLFAERPTLQQLLQDGDHAALPIYLQAFQNQSRLDILLLCDQNDQFLAGENDLSACSQTDAAGFGLLAEQPVLLVSRPVLHEVTGERLATAVVGVWLDHNFLRELAVSTGVEQSILLPDGTRLSSSLLAGPAAAAAPLTPYPDIPYDLLTDQPGRRAIELDGRRYYTAFFPLTGSDNQPFIVSEVGLPVDELIATSNRALTILAVSTGLVATLGVILSVWYVRQLIAPLQQLTHVARRISQGDLLATIPRLPGPEEVRTLTRALEKSQASMVSALEERSQARDWLNSLIQSIVEGVVTFDAAGRVTFMSQGAELLAGWRREAAIGQSINALFPLADSNAGAFLDHIPPPGSKRQIEVVNHTGKRLILAVTGARLAPPEGQTTQVALVLRDVTEEEVQRHLRSFFLANISHEFRTPLSTLNASIELLLNEAEALSAAEMRQLLKPTYLSLLGLQTLIDNLLESSSIEAGRFTVQKRPIDLNQTITNALRIVQPLLERRQQSLSLTEPARFPEIHADPARLTQVLVNLLGNASKYSPIGQTIDLQIEQRDDTLRVTVADRGPGIPAAERENLFQRFVRLDAQNGEQYGIGLGLYVVKTVITAHEGRVGVDERPGGGSIFWFELPLP